jgi:hypothetical protein
MVNSVPYVKVFKSLFFSLITLPVPLFLCVTVQSFQMMGMLLELLITFKLLASCQHIDR